MADDNEAPLMRTKDITRTRGFSLVPDAEARAELARTLGILGIRKLTFTGRITPEGDADLRLTAQLGATVVQTCVVTLEPVTSRIDEPVTRLYLAEMPEVPAGEEVEMPEDDSAEPMPRELDLNAVMAEALALALPPWPRAASVAPVEVSVTEPGNVAMSDEDAKPFAGLKSLRDTLEDPDGNED